MTSLSCLHCLARNEYRMEAMHLTLWPTGVVHLDFFCLSCREENHQVVSAELGERLAAYGITATVVTAPLEVVERLQGPATSLTVADAAALEDMNHDVFNEIVRRELSLG